MKLFFLIFILAAFIQTSFLEINLCLMLIIARSFVVERPSNYVVAFGGGIILGLLSGQNLGYLAVIFLITTKLIQIFKKLPISSNFLTVIPISAVIMIIFAWVELLLFNHTVNLIKVVLESILILPIYALVRFWEERFIVRHEIKLKFKG